MNIEQIIQRLNSILDRNSDRKVNQLIPEDIRHLKIAIKELKQGQTLPVDSVIVPKGTLPNDCKHINIDRQDGLDECLDCGVRNY